MPPGGLVLSAWLPPQPASCSPGEGHNPPPDLPMCGASEKNMHQGRPVCPTHLADPPVTVWVRPAPSF